ncbi:hypothetical protein LguiB_016993 [Lonicera macranthoides]
MATDLLKRNQFAVIGQSFDEETAPSKSCINVALGFVSPENLEEYIRLADECRVLPRNHRAKEDKLKVKCMALHAMSEEVKTLMLDDDEDDAIGVPLADVSKEDFMLAPVVKVEPSAVGTTTATAAAPASGPDICPHSSMADAEQQQEVPHGELGAKATREDISQSPVVKVELTEMALWEGHMVLESYVDLLSHMKREHPETFQHDTLWSASMQTYALNLLGEAYVSFAKKSVDNMGVEDISHFKDLFSDLQYCFKFDVSWLRKRLDCIEEVRFKKTRVGGELVALGLCIEAREKELAQLKALYHEKTEEVGAAYKRAADGLLIGWTPQESF